MFEKTENKWKRGRGWPILKKKQFLTQIKFDISKSKPRSIQPHESGFYMLFKKNLFHYSHDKLDRQMIVLNQIES